MQLVFFHFQIAQPSWDADRRLQFLDRYDRILGHRFFAEPAGNAGELGAACIVDRSNGKADIGVPLVSLLRMDVPAYPADQLPPELAAIPAIKPGSRALA